MTGSNNVFANGFDRQRAQEQAKAENASRLARFAFTHETRGRGAVQYPKPVMFGAAFFDRPSVTRGVELASGELDPAGDWPRCDAGVTRWVRDANGLYVGAYMYFLVETAAVSYHLTHHLVFEGVAQKALPLSRLAGL